MKNFDLSPWHNRKGAPVLSLASVGLLCLISAVAGFAIGNFWVDREVRLAISAHQKLTDERNALEGDLSHSRQQMAILQRGSEIDRMAVQNNQKRIAELRQDLGEAREKLEFYQRIVSPELIDDGLYVQDFRFVGKSETNGRQYRFTLSKGIRAKRFVEGRLLFTLEGSKDGELENIEISRLNPQSEKPIRFKFRYFQTFSGELNWPVSFIPKRLVLTVKPSSKGYEAVEKSWDWSDLQNES